MSEDWDKFSEISQAALKEAGKTGLSRARLKIYMVKAAGYTGGEFMALETFALCAPSAKVFEEVFDEAVAEASADN